MPERKADVTVKSV